MTESTQALAHPDPRPHNGQPRGLPVFLLALLAGLGVHLAGLFLFRLEIAAPAPPPLPPPSLRLSSAGNAQQRAAMLQVENIHDPQLIYASTPHNYTARSLPSVTPAQPRVFQNYGGAALPAATDNNLHPLSGAGSQPIRPSDTLQTAQWDFLGGFGQAATTKAEAPKRGALLQVVAQSTNGRGPATRQVTWPENMAPNAGNSRWQPASFILYFNDVGLLGEPVLEHSSGVQAVDDDLKAKLKQWYGRRPLPTGSYTVEIGP